MAKMVTTRQKKPTGDPTLLGRKFKQRLKSKDVLLGATATEYMRSSLVKFYCAAGFDYIFIENEHVIFDGPALADFVMCTRDNGIPVIAKVGDLSRAETARLLEMGITGIQLPRTESREQLLDFTQGEASEAWDRSIDIQVMRLRRKIEPNPSQPAMIRTVRGVGYVFSATINWE